MVHSIDQPFAHAASTVAPDPTGLWAAQIRKPPYPTNSAWLNFVLNKGSCAEYLHPYMIQSVDGKLSICYPSRGVNPAFIFQSFVPNLSISCKEEGSTSHVVAHYDDLSVTLEYGSKLSVPLVRGCPYVTFLFKGGTPVFSTIHAVLELRSNAEETRHKLVMNNGQTWIIYSSSRLPLNKDLSTCDHFFKGVIRIACVPPGDCSEDVLDRYSMCYPVGGMADLSTAFQIRYVWRTLGWGELLMLSLPHHREILHHHMCSTLPQFSYQSIDGALEGIVGDQWTLRIEPLSIGWYSRQGVSPPEAKDDIIRSAMKEVDQLCPAQLTIPSTYFHGKALARAARLGLIAEEVSCPSIVEKVHEFLVRAITPWFDGTFAGNALLYDRKWGGIISRDGANDPGADFGLGIYNDHHFHFGYFCYAGAVLAKLDPCWGQTWKCHLYALVKDYMNTDPHDRHFTRLRCFDPWVMHSWAGGLTQFADGRNQESTSEAVNAYYAAALVGLAYGDPHLINVGLTLTALENLSSRTLWHVKSDNMIYEPEFVAANKVVGVLWANKRDTNLWFAPRENREMCLGIQVLPISPITEIMFQDIKFVKELVEWALPSLNREGVTDGWRGFVYALMALYHPTKAHRLIHELVAHDDGNSLTNLLWWVHTRPSPLL